MTSYSNIYGTFMASIRSVGTAVTMAAIGVYLHQRGFIDAGGKRTLAKVSQQVTFPLFLFTKIIYCNQDWSHNPCPDVTKTLGDVWVLLFWPLYVVGLGIFVGWVVARLTRTPKHQIRAVLAACGFGNSTGLPITLLTVVHANFPATSDLGRVDPTLFLSVFLLLYPVLQWGLGGYLLAPQEENESSIASNSNNPEQSGAHHGGSFRCNVLNHQTKESKYKGLASTDEGLYMTEADLTKLIPKQPSEPNQLDTILDESPNLEEEQYLLAGDVDPPVYEATIDVSNEDDEYGYYDDEKAVENQNGEDKDTNKGYKENDGLMKVRDEGFDADSFCETISNVLDRCLQPPVIGAILGIICAVIPFLRGIFVDLVDRDSTAPLQFLFDGLYSIGQAAVPLNMMILGCNLSSSSMGKLSANSDSILSMETMIGVVIGKMIVMPMIGILTTIVLKLYFWNIPDNIDGSFYLVMMIVFLTPTANNVMVMVELSGSGAKEGIARVIALQYAVAPIILSLTMTIAIGVASNWT